MNQLTYTEKGDGIPVVLLHGFCERKEIWKETIAHLSKLARVIAPDLPGFGANPALATAVSMDSMAEQVYHLLQDLGIDTCILVGHSMGGYISLAFAEKYPQALQGLCLFHSTALADTEEKKRKRDETIIFLEKNGMEAFARGFIRGLFYEPDLPRLKAAVDALTIFTAATPTATAIQATKAMRNRPDRTHVLKNINCPVLFIAGKEDAAVPLPTLHQQVFLPKGDVYLQAISHTAHMGMFENKEATLGMLHIFVQQITCSQ